MLNVLYEDNHIIVVAKPCNVPVQSDKSGDQDLLSMVKQYVKEKYNKPGEVFIGLCTGLTVRQAASWWFARNSKSAARLSQQVRTHDMQRTYYAVVRGVPARKEGRVESYLLKNTETNTVSVVPQTTEGAKHAQLDYKVLQTIDDPKDGVLSLVQVQLQTGRSHQIRVQMASLGCPLWGDQRYGMSVNKKGQQLALWAVKLTLMHPTLKDRRVFVCYPQTEQPWNRFEIQIAEKNL